VILRKDAPASLSKRYESTFFRMTNVPVQERYQYWTDLTNLEPDSTYIVEDVVVLIGNKKLLTSQQLPLKFRTGPGLNSTEEVSFVTGGDVEWSDAGISLSKQAAQEKILFAIVGGDIAYENAIPSCFMRYDEWFYNWNKYMVTPDGYSIPILTAIGNHEAGGWRKNHDFVPFYFNYFPHELGLQNVKPSRRRAYHQHIFAQHTAVTVLDSYVVTPIVGEQEDWLQKTLEGISKNRTNRFALYHASAYPAHVNDIEDITSQLRNHYSPLFEKYDVKAVLENHYHCYVDSYPIRNNQIDEKTGVKYLGQGSWGVPPTKHIDKNWWIKEADTVQHIYHIRCKESKCEIMSLVFDLASQNTIIRSKFHL
jgi:hypothetical protein